MKVIFGIVLALVMSACPSFAEAGVGGWTWTHEEGLYTFNNDPFQVQFTPEVDYWSFGIGTDQQWDQSGEVHLVKFGKDKPYTMQFAVLYNLMYIKIFDIEKFLKYPMVEIVLDSGKVSCDLSGLAKTIKMAGLSIGGKS